MRKNILAGNWKMNTSASEGLALFNEVKSGWNADWGSNLICVIAPPSTHLSLINPDSEKGIYIAGQNCSDQDNGAYTGEISAGMLKSVGADFVIIGHSERRGIFGEENDLLKRKVAAAIRNGLSPIYCCGEQQEQREEGSQEDVVRGQLQEGLFHLSAEDFGKVVVAYEPVWAIGTGMTATPEQAQEMHSFIRTVIEENYNMEIAMDTSVLYGGSCNPANANDLFANEDVDGGLIGGASLIAGDFLQIAKSLSNSIP
jgi:triosephosphate isomerase